MTDRAVLIRSFFLTSVVGSLFIASYWSSRGEAERGTLRSLGFIGIMGGVHLFGCRAYRRQGFLGSGSEFSGEWAGEDSASTRPRSLSTRVAPAYLDGFKLAVVEQVLILGVAALVLDGGWLIRVCGMAALAYWGASALIVARRPSAPTPLDLVLIRYGSLILPLSVGGLASSLR